MGGNIMQGPTREALRLAVHSSRIGAFQSARSIVLIVNHVFNNGPGRRIAVLSNLRKDSGEGAVLEVPWRLLESESNRTLRKGGAVEFSDGRTTATFLVTEVMDAGLKGRAPAAEPLRKQGSAAKATN